MCLVVDLHVVVEGVLHWRKVSQQHKILCIWWKSSGLQFPVMNETAFSRISRKKRTTVRGIYKFSKLFYQVNFCAILFFSRNLNDWLFRNSTISRFSGNFPKKFKSVPFVIILKLLELSANGKCPIVTLWQSSKSSYSSCCNLINLKASVEKGR